MRVDLLKKIEEDREKRASDKRELKNPFIEKIENDRFLRASGQSVKLRKEPVVPVKPVDLTEEERRAQLVTVTDTSKPDAPPKIMTLGEYEDIVTEEKRVFYEAVKTNSRYRAMTAHENQQHSGELAEKYQKEFESRYRMFTPKEERMHGKEAHPLEDVQPAMMNTARSMVANGDFEGARDYLTEGYTNGLYSLGTMQDALAKLVSENTITPETRLAGLEKAKTAMEEKWKTGYWSKDTEEQEKWKRQGDLYETMYNARKEAGVVAPYEKEKQAAEEQRDYVFSADTTAVDAYIAEKEKEIETIQQSLSEDEVYVEPPAREDYETDEEYMRAVDDYHENFFSGVRQLEGNEKKVQSIEDDLYYARGVKTFAHLSDAEKEVMLQYISSDLGQSPFVDDEYRDFYGEMRKMSHDEWKALKQKYRLIEDRMSKDDFGRMEEALRAIYQKITATTATVEQTKLANEHPVGASVLSVFSNLLGGVTATVEIVSHELSNIGKQDGYVKPINVNSGAFGLTKATNLIRGTVADNIEREVGGTGGKVSSFLYQTGMSAVDSYVASFAGGWGGAILLGTSSMANAFLEAKERGANDSKAIWTGIFAGVFEMLFERVSIGNLNALKETPVGELKDIFKNVAKSAGVNASEEGFTQAATALSDYLINGEFSVYGSMYNELIGQGIAEAEAKKRVQEAFWKENLLSAAGGALMGIGFAGGTGAVNYAKGKTGDAAYKKTLSFAEQLDSLKAGTYNVNLDLYVSETPKIYTNLGFSKGPTLMRNGKIAEIYKKHPEMTDDVLKQIPQAFQNPLLILKSKTHSDESVVAITQVETDKGPMIIPVWVNQDGTYLNIELDEIQKVNTNFVATAYGRNVQGLLEYALENDGFLYSSADKEKVGQLFALYGLQLPTPLKLSDSDIRISQSDADVNSNYMQNVHNIIQDDTATNSISQVGGNSQEGTDGGKYTLDDADAMIDEKLPHIEKDSVRRSERLNAFGILEYVFTGEELTKADLKDIRKTPEIGEIINTVLGTSIDFSSKSALKEVNAAIKSGEIAVRENGGRAAAGAGASQFANGESGARAAVSTVNTTAEKGGAQGEKTALARGAAIERMAATVGSEGAKVLREFYTEAEGDEISYIERVLPLYNAGKAGKIVNVDALSRAEQAMYNAGLIDAKVEAARAAKAPAKTKTPSVPSAKTSEYKADMTVPRGEVKVDKDVKMSRAQFRQLKALAKSTNTAITVGGKCPVDENGNQKRGWYVEDDGHIHIFADAKVVVHTKNGARTLEGGSAAVMVVAGHEFTHRLKTLNAEGYKRFANFALSKIGGYVEGLMEEKGWSRPKAEEEAVCDFAMQFVFSDEKTVREITRTDSKLAALVREIIEKIREVLHLNKGAENDAVLQLMDEAAELWKSVYDEAVENVKNGVAETKNTAESGVKWSRADIKDDARIVSFVKDALGKKGNFEQKEIGDISSTENSAINRFANTHGDGYRGKYTGGKHIVDAAHIRHAKNTHSDIMLEALRAQLPITEDDIVATLSAVANGQAYIVAPTHSLDGDESILQEVQVNGYTLYAEEIVRQVKEKPSNLEGRTIYKTPTKTTAQSLGTSPKGLPKGLSGASDNSIHQNVNLSIDNFLLDATGEKQTLYAAVKSGTPVSVKAVGSLIFLSADKSNIAGASTVEAVNIKTKKPFYITDDNTVYKASNEDVAQRVNDLKAKGYDCFIFDYHEGDRYAVMVTNKAQIVPISEHEKHSTSGNDADLLASVYEAREVWKRAKKMTPMQIANMQLDAVDPLPKVEPRKPSGVNAENGKESKFYGSAMRSDNIFDETRDLIESMDDVRYYYGTSNEETLNEANDRLNLKGQTEANRFLVMNPAYADATDIAEGFILLKRYQDKGDFETAAEVARKLREMGTSAGQTVQAFSILGRLTPEGMAIYAQKELDQIREEMIRKHSKAWVEQRKEMFQLTAEEMEKIQQNMILASALPDGRDKTVLIAEIASMLEAKLPTTALRMIKAWTRNCMLLNPKTMLRNVIGNAIMMPAYAVDDFAGAGLDRLLAKKTGVRTKGATYVSKANVRAVAKGIYESYDDFRRNVNTRQAEGDRFELGHGDDFHYYTLEQRKAATPVKRAAMALSNALNKVDRVTGFLLDMGDRPFFEAHFVNSINNQCRLNGVTEPTAEMVDIATTEALQRTWQDDNGYTKYVQNVRNGLNFGKSWGLGSIIVPFTKTPANLTKALIEYSPVGLVKSITWNAHRFTQSVKSGTPDVKLQKAFVDSFAKGVTGTLTMALGMLLANFGIISGGDDDEDKDVAQFKRNIMGIAPYSVTVNGISYSYDWAQPIGGMFAISADLVQNIKDGNDPEVTGLGVLGAAGNTILNALSAGGNVLFEQSFLQGVSDLFGNDNLMGGLIEAASGVTSQFVPTALGQIAQMCDPYVRTSFRYNNTLGTAGNKVVAKVPGMRNKLAPVVDVLGHEVESFNEPWNVMLNPSNMYEKTATEAAMEIYRVYEETGDVTVVPRVAPYYLNHKGEKYEFTPHERAEYQRVMGSTNEAIVTDLLKSKGYSALDAEARAQVLTLATDYATAEAKYTYLAEQGVRYERDSWMVKAAEGTANGVSVADFLVAKAAIADIKGGLKDADGETIDNSESLLKMEAIYAIEGLTDSKRKYLFEAFGIGKSVRHYNKACVAEQLAKMRKKAQ